MKYDIVADAARSYYIFCNSSNKDDQKKSQHFQHELQSLTSQFPKTYMKEYDNVSIICACITGLWDNITVSASHGDFGFIQSRKFVALIDRLIADLFRKMALRNNCLPMQILGHRIVFVAGLPSEESYGCNVDEFKNSLKTKDGSENAKNAIQLGLDLINVIK